MTKFSDVQQIMLNDLMREAWPDGVPAEELAIMSSMPPDRLSITLQRLDSVLDEERGRPLQDAASRLGMDRIAFFRLRQSWKKHRSLRSLTPFMGRAPRRVGIGRERESELALKLVQASRDRTELTGLTEKLVAQTGGNISRQTATRLLRDAAGRLSAEMGEISLGLGTEVLVDFTGTAMRSRTQGLVCLCLVVETTSRAVLGWGAGPNNRSGDLLASALERAVADFGEFGSANNTPGVIRFVVPESDDTFDAAAVSSFVLHNGAVPVVTGERRFGRELAALLGHRMGRMSLHPRSYAVGRAPAHGMSPFRDLEMDDAVALVSEAVRDHNASRTLALLDGLRPEDPALAERLRRQIEGVSAVNALKLVLGAPELWRGGVDRLTATIYELGAILSLLRHR